MTDDIAAQLEAADHALADLVATYRQREMHAFHACHDEEGHAWAGKVDELQHVRDLIRRQPFTAATQGGSDGLLRVRP